MKTYNIYNKNNELIANNFYAANPKDCVERFLKNDIELTTLTVENTYTHVKTTIESVGHCKIDREILKIEEEKN